MRKLLVTASVVLALAALQSAAFAGAVCNKNCCKKDEKTQASKASKDPAAQEVVVDPVCGMDVNVSDAKHSSKYEGKNYYFCNESCKKAFDKQPSAYIGKDSKK